LSFRVMVKMPRVRLVVKSKPLKHENLFSFLIFSSRPKFFREQTSSHSTRIGKGKDFCYGGTQKNYFACVGGTVMTSGFAKHFSKSSTPTKNTFLRLKFHRFSQRRNFSSRHTREQRHVLFPSLR
jgi:hypothetical protein